MADLIIIGVLAAAVVLVIRYQKKQKGSGCGGSCAGCSGCGLKEAEREKKNG